MAMSKALFNDLMAGLNEAAAHAAGEAAPAMRVRRVDVDRAEIAQTRKAMGLTQQEFAEVMGAGLGTVRKWEQGERRPTGAAAMLLRVAKLDPKVVLKAARRERKPGSGRPSHGA